MSRKSKHHKPKGPRHPPQGQQHQQQQPQPKEEQSTNQEVQSPAAATPVEPVAQPVQPQQPPPQPLREPKADVAPVDKAVPSTAEDPPAKPKRSRNRGKKNKRTPGDEEEGEEEEEAASENADEPINKDDGVADKEDGQKKTNAKQDKNAPTKKDMEDLILVTVERKDEGAQAKTAEPKTEGSEENAKSNKNKKGKNKKDKDVQIPGSPVELTDIKDDKLIEEKSAARSGEVDVKEVETKPRHDIIDPGKTDKKGKNKKGKDVQVIREEVTSVETCKIEEDKIIEEKPTHEQVVSIKVEPKPHQEIDPGKTDKKGKNKKGKDIQVIQEEMIPGSPVEECQVKEEKIVEQKQEEQAAPEAVIGGKEADYTKPACELEMGKSDKKGKGKKGKDIQAAQEIAPAVAVEVGEIKKDDTEQPKSEEKPIPEETQVAKDTDGLKSVCEFERGKSDKKGKNKKGKDAQTIHEEIVPGSPVEISEVKEEKVVEPKSEEKPLQQEMLIVEKIDDSKLICDSDKGKSNKKDKKGKKGGQKSESEEPKNSETEAVSVSDEKVSADKAEPQIMVCPYLANVKCEEMVEEKKNDENMDDDILPALASSIEKTLEQLIVCESDIVLDEKLKLEEAKKAEEQKKNKDKKDQKNKSKDKEHQKKSKEGKQLTDDKIEDSKKDENKEHFILKEETQLSEVKTGEVEKEIVENICSTITATVCQTIQNPIQEEQKMETKKPEKKIISEAVEIKTSEIEDRKSDPQSSIVEAVALFAPEPKNENLDQLKVEDKRAQSASPSRKDKRKKSPKPPKREDKTGKSNENSQKKKEDEKLSDQVVLLDSSSLIPEKNKTEKKNEVICEISPASPSIIQEIKSETKLENIEPVVMCSVPDEIINKLLCDIPLPFIEDEKKGAVLIPSEEMFPVTKSETVLEGMPKCKEDPNTNTEPSTSSTNKNNDLKNELKQITDLLAGIAASQPPQTSEDSTKSFKIESNVENEMKKALEVALGVIMCDVPPVETTKNEPAKLTEIIEQQAEASTKIKPEEKEAISSQLSDGKEDDFKCPHKKKSKKHDKPKPQIPESAPLLEDASPQQEVSTQVEAKMDTEKPSIVEQKIEEPKEEIKDTDSPKPAKRMKDKKNKNKGGHGKSEQTTSGNNQQSQDSTKKSDSEKKQESTEEKKDSSSAGEKGKDVQKDQESIEHSQEKPISSKSLDSNTGASSSTDSSFKNVEGSKSTTKSGSGNEEKRKSPPKSPSKNLLGRSSTPVESSKYDYKKEKNKDEEAPNDDESARVNLRNMDPRDVPESSQSEDAGSKRSTLLEEHVPTRNLQEIDKRKIVEYDMRNDEGDEADEFVYKYSFRTVFIASACHVCKMNLKETRIVCRFCHLVAYCGDKHRDDDWISHQSFCYAVSTFASAKGQTHVYEDAKMLNGQDYRLLRMQTIVSCEKILKRKLCPWEQEALLYPRICSLSTCREWRTPLLKDCQECGQISFCASDPNHLSQEHNVWCGPYKLYYKLVAHQLHHGRLEPQLPMKAPPSGYLIPEKSSQLFDDLYGEILNLDECHFATLTQLSTVPLTTLYAHQKWKDRPKKDDAIINGHEEGAERNHLNQRHFCVHLIGAELQFEGDTLKKWESFFLHLMSDVKELTVVFVGPELNAAKLPVDLLTKIKLCQSCRQTERKIKFDFVDGTLYHDYVGSQRFIRPDIICAFNPGFHRSTGYAGLDTWPETIASALKLKVPLCVTAYTAHEMPRDLERVRRCAPDKGAPVEVILPPSHNPYGSLRPDRNFVSDDEMPLIFKNYHLMIVSG